MNRILLLIDDRQNRRRLAEALTDRYQLIAPDPLSDDCLTLLHRESFDLGIFDGSALDRCWEIAQGRKQAAAPRFLPFLLVTPRQNVGYATHHLWKSIDEIILSPIEKVELQARVEILLRARAYSREQETRRQAEADRDLITGVLERVGDGIVALDKDWNYTYLNQRAAQMLGRQRPADLLGKSYWEEYPEAAGTPFARAYQRALEEQVPIVLEDYYAPWDRWFENRIYSSPEGLTIYFTEITERKRAEEEIQGRAEELAALNALGRQISQTLSLDEVISMSVEESLRVVQADLAFLFLREGEKLHLAGFGPPGADDIVREFPEHRVGECICGLAVSRGKALYSRDIFQDLRCTWEECKQAGLRSFAALPLRSGEEVIGVVGLAAEQERDFEDQAGFLETLASQIAVAIQNANLYREARRRSRHLALLSDITIAALESPDLDAMLQTLVDHLGELFEADGAYLTFWDVERGLPIPRAAYGPFRESYRRIQTGPEVKTVTGSVLEAGRVLPIEDVFDTPYLDRELAARFPTRSTLGLPLIAGDQKIGAALIEYHQPRSFSADDIAWADQVARQISLAVARAQLLAELQSYATELEQRVARRTAELAVVKERAEAADRVKSAFLATMSHELRTPLNSIIGFTGVILQELAGPLNPEQRKQLGMVQSSARHLLALINDVLDLSRIEAGQLEIASETFDMRDAIANVVQAVRPLAERKGLTLTTAIAPEVGQITSDRRRVEQILMNLLSNAIKFTDAGQVSVQSSVISNQDLKDHGPAYTRSTLKTDNWLLITVRDTGIGIKSEDMDKLFEPFRQIDAGLTRQYEGTGLGLSICKRLVEMLGGRIWAESAGEGKGSTFTFRLPVRKT